MWNVKFEMFIESEKKKKMDLNEIVHVLVAELEKEKNVRQNAKVEAQNLREDVDRLKGKVEEVSVRPKIEVELGMEQSRLD